MIMPVVEILANLVRHNSVNSLLTPPGPGEGAIANWIGRFCSENGIACQFQPVDGERANVLARVEGREPGLCLLFIAHMDTVAVEGWERDPFGAHIEGTRLYGRGACDTKGSLAAMLAALVDIKDQKPRATVVVAGSVDEECGKAGARALARANRQFEAAVVGEPTDLGVVVAHNGSVRFKIETRGQAAHTSRPYLGVNAITGMGRVLNALDELMKRLQVRKHPLVGPPTLTVSLISGGTNICVVPDRCEISIDRRLVPGEAPAEAIAEVENLLSDLRRVDRELSVRMLPAVEDPSVETPETARIVEVARRACAKAGRSGEVRGVPYGTDASQLAPAGIACVVLGPGSIDQAHTVEEYVEIAEVERALEIYRQIMLEY
jgi:acetylornithine deacetylase ArgE